jgi:hypothetical protein
LIFLTASSSQHHRTEAEQEKGGWFDGTYCQDAQSAARLENHNQLRQVGQFLDKKGGGAKL